MDKDEFQTISTVIDGRLAAMGTDGATHMLRVFELISASFANEEDRPSVLVHGHGNNLAVLSINVAELEMVDMLATAYAKMHDVFIGDIPPRGEMN
jgi:hypothetical protein